MLYNEDEEEFVEHRYTQLKKFSGETFFPNVSDTWSFISDGCIGPLVRNVDWWWRTTCPKRLEKSFSWKGLTDEGPLMKDHWWRTTEKRTHWWRTTCPKRLEKKFLLKTSWAVYTYVLRIPLHLHNTPSWDEYGHLEAKGYTISYHSSNYSFKLRTMKKSKFMNMLYDFVVLFGCLDTHKLVIHNGLKFFAVLAMFSTAGECRNLHVC